MFLGKLALVFILASLASAAWSAPRVIAGSDNSVLGAVRANLEKKYPGARIEFTAPAEYVRGTAPAADAEIQSVQVADDSGRGDVPFTVQFKNGEETAVSAGHVSFSALMAARTAVRRVLPGEKLQADAFATRDINVAAGQYRDYRGVILPMTTDIARLESRQTIIEGQPVLSSFVQKIPDVRRGDAIRIRLVSGSLTLSTIGTASEPGYLGDSIRVMSQKTKRELAGRLVEPGVVEVAL